MDGDILMSKILKYKNEMFLFILVVITYLIITKIFFLRLLYFII